jgi:hypothetical protein
MGVLIPKWLAFGEVSKESDFIASRFLVKSPVDDFALLIGAVFHPVCHVVEFGCGREGNLVDCHIGCLSGWGRELSGAVALHLRNCACFFVNSGFFFECVCVVSSSCAMCMC